MISLSRLKVISLLICFAAFLGGSCSSKKPNIEQLAPLPESMCRVGIIPFVNKTSYQDGDVLFYRVFVSGLSRVGDFELVPEGDMRRAFQQIRLPPGKQQPNYDQLRILGDYLDTDILLSGTILQMKEDSLHGEIVPYMTVKLEMLDSRSGQTVWSVYHVKNGTQYRKVMHFGVISTITQLATQMAEEILESWRSEGFGGTCLE